MIYPIFRLKKKHCSTDPGVYQAMLYRTMHIRWKNPKETTFNFEKPFTGITIQIINVLKPSRSIRQDDACTAHQRFGFQDSHRYFCNHRSFCRSVLRNNERFGSTKTDINWFVIRQDWWYRGLPDQTRRYRKTQTVRCMEQFVISRFIVSKFTGIYFLVQ